jgi:RNA polymerase sigma-70 factor (ECF subfamily)
MFTDEQFTLYAKQFMDTIFRVAFSYLKSRADADDITQNVLIKLYRAGKEFESDSHIKRWLIRVTINECKKALISPWRKAEPIEDYANTLSFATPEHSELFYMVMDLPKKYRVAVFLYYYEDYSTDEISQLLGIPNATVRTHLKRGREQLKNTLTEANGYV